nr:hypothetical protein [Tanacetum cinerariifolium]
MIDQSRRIHVAAKVMESLTSLEDSHTGEDGLLYIMSIMDIDSVWRSLAKLANVVEIEQIEEKEAETEEGKGRKERAARIDVEAEAVTGIGLGIESGTGITIITEIENTAGKGPIVTGQVNSFFDVDYFFANPYDSNQLDCPDGMSYEFIYNYLVLFMTQLLE